jgi:hypothetical protein
MCTGPWRFSGQVSGPVKLTARVRLVNGLAITVRAPRIRVELVKPVGSVLFGGQSAAQGDIMKIYNFESPFARVPIKAGEKKETTITTSYKFQMDVASSKDIRALQGIRLQVESVEAPIGRVSLAPAPFKGSRQLKVQLAEATSFGIVARIENVDATVKPRKPLKLTMVAAAKARLRIQNTGPTPVQRVVLRGSLVGDPGCRSTESTVSFKPPLPPGAERALEKEIVLSRAMPFFLPVFVPRAAVRFTTSEVK